MTTLRDDLLARGYTELTSFRISELMGPVKEGTRRGSLFYWLLLLAMSVAGVLLVYGILHWKATGLLTVGRFSMWFSLGVGAVMFLIPLHEGIHGLLFRYFGAKDVRYGVVWRKLMFYAVAHNFAVSYRQFLVIALGPYVLLSAAMGLAALVVPPGGQAFLLGMYGFHTLCCIGDFGLCGYMHQFRHLNPLTFDDADNSVSYFYVTSH
ncbi:DUF3267 domain-containing protein [Chitinophaga deserti]|uniref:DUF3267 domain-containing protein n=1 Tax=Chitinophaga deserti TaxID=2164099 RepID=UPI000D6DC198|nr:DUF3267 domain-containing protein [Chitinophaga deserti]